MSLAAETWFKGPFCGVRHSEMDAICCREPGHGGLPAWYDLMGLVRSGFVEFGPPPYFAPITPPWLGDHHCLARERA